SMPGTTVVVGMVAGYSILSTCSRSPGMTTYAREGADLPWLTRTGPRSRTSRRAFDFKISRTECRGSVARVRMTGFLSAGAAGAPAAAAPCTHYHGPLADGLVVGDTVRCQWHPSCFSLRTGEALRAPALDPIACYRVERSGDTVFVRGKAADAPRRRPPAAP